MRLLLDTHILLWALYRKERLPERALDLLWDTPTAPACSVVSLWEVQIKHMRRPSSMPVSAKRLYDDCKGAGLALLAVRPEHVLALDGLEVAPGATPQKDPFDRLLLAQAKREGLGLVTADAAFATYDEPCLLLTA